MEYQICYLIGDPESFLINIKLEQEMNLESFAFHYKFPQFLVAVGYALCIMEHKDRYIKDCPHLEKPGTFAICSTDGKIQQILFSDEHFTSETIKKELEGNG